jgi:hypothetical protein
MRGISKLISKSNMTYLPTSFPVYFYGMPDNRIYIIYIGTFDLGLIRGLEYVFGYFEDMNYEYQSGKIYYLNCMLSNTSDFFDLVNRPQIRYKIIGSCRNIDSMRDAVKIMEDFSTKRITTFKKKEAILLLN